jgi:hypothetical protein
MRDFLGSFRQFSALDVSPEIVESKLAIEKVEDWSRVRSPSRARRRLAMGHRQNIVTVEKPAAYEINFEGRHQIVIHPILMAQLNRRLAEHTEQFNNNLLRDTMLGIRR